MNTIIVTLAIVLIIAALIAYALYSFTAVKASANIGKSGFSIEAKGRRKK
jgi:hypothetical protein